MRILLVEPDESMRSLWIDRMSLDNERVTLAASEAEARNAFSSIPFTAAVVRFPLPAAMNSDEFRKQIFANCHFSIALTDGSSTAIEQAYAAGFADSLAALCGQQQWTTKLNHAQYLERLEQRLAQAQKLESIGELTAGIAHEINTPIQYVGDNTRFVQDSLVELMTVLTTCQALVEQANDGDDIERFKEQFSQSLKDADLDYLMEEIPSAIVQTLEGVDRVTNIVRAMKEFAHPGVSEMVPTDLSKSIENTLMVARNEWKYVAEVKTEFDAEMPLVWSLPGELNQVLLNMIVNAAHAIGEAIGESSDTKGFITIKTQRSGNFAEIRISDTGAGISPNDLTRIFDPFFTTKKAGKGTGQGLAIAHSVIVERHCGMISVESEKGRGTTFIIQIPLEQKRPVAIPVPDSPLAVLST